MTVVLEHTGFPPLTKDEFREAVTTIMNGSDAGEDRQSDIGDAVMLGYLIAARKVTGASLN